MDENIFDGLTPNEGKLQKYGFAFEGDAWTARFDMIDGQFMLKVAVSSGGEVASEVIDLAADEVYTLHLVGAATGAFVGRVREEVSSRLRDIAANCFDGAIFNGGQVGDMIDYARQKYGDDLEFLWEKFKNNAVLRRKDTKKWYAAFIRLPFEKLGIRKEGEVDIIDLRMPKEMPQEAQKHVMPAYHMNKRTCFTALLDGSVPLDILCALLDESYLLAK